MPTRSGVLRGVQHGAGGLGQDEHDGDQLADRPEGLGGGVRVAVAELVVGGTARAAALAVPKRIRVMGSARSV